MIHTHTHLNDKQEIENVRLWKIPKCIPRRVDTAACLILSNPFEKNETNALVILQLSLLLPHCAESSFRKELTDTKDRETHRSVAY